MLNLLFNNRAVQKTLFVSMTAIGGVGILSGAWQAAGGDAAGVGAIIGGATGLAIGSYGLSKIKAAPPAP